MLTNDFELTVPDMYNSYHKNKSKYVCGFQRYMQLKFYERYSVIYADEVESS